MASKSKVYFFFDNVDITLRNRLELKKSIEYLFKREKKMFLRLNYIFCGDKKLLFINKIYLNRDYYTDVITFDLSEKQKIIGEIYISTDRVRENAKNLKIPLYQELLRVMFHGALHLCGYNDTTKQQKLKMRSKEDYYINLGKFNV
jgi:probable rRNA maturation factor